MVAALDEVASTLRDQLAFLYGPERADGVLAELMTILESRAAQPTDRHSFSERDVALITYGDIVRSPGEPPLATLGSFLFPHIARVINTVHILPFYPYSSDDGFSVIDYRQVDPDLGAWSDIARLGETFRLMFDAVVNHVSAQSDWFEAFLRDDPDLRDYFTVVVDDFDTSAVFRPRELPLLTEFETTAGPRKVWTTFSADQIDLNFANPAVLLEVVDTLLLYVAKGAGLIRLDAIAFIWKESGTSCIHLPETHRIIQLMRTVLEAVAPKVAIVTETNVPHQENISYFGDGSNEANMVYNFALPPLVLHTFHTGDTQILSRWAERLEAPSGTTTFFNFLASHDGIGVGGGRGWLTDIDIDRLAERTTQLGGRVSYKTGTDGNRVAYELNINFLDALGDPAELDVDEHLVARRFLTSQAIMLALRGVPGIYFHSLFGSRGWTDGVEHQGTNRAINRQKLDRDQLDAELADDDSLRSIVFGGYLHLLQQRIFHPAFDPHADQRVVVTDPAVFTLLRTALDGAGQVVCIHNVTSEAQVLSFDLSELSVDVNVQWSDLVGGESISANSGTLTVQLAPYQTMWLAREGSSTG